MAIKKHRPIPPLRQSDIDRFWKHVDVRGADECWPWKASKLLNTHGQETYGVIRINHLGFHANRISYFIHTGVDLGALMCLHTCDHPTCVNPDHLKSGTNIDNMAQMRRSGRSAQGERHFKHKFTTDQVLEIRRLSREGFNYTDLAIKFSSCVSTIKSIATYQRWKHLP